MAQWQRDIVPADQLRDWQLLPARPNWAQGWEQRWQPGERGAQLRLDAFLRGAVADYDAGRNYPRAQRHIALVRTPAFRRDRTRAGL